MDSSKNLNLNLPGQTDFYNVNDFNENFNIIDEKIKELEDEGANVTPEGIGALSLENENLSNIDFLAWVKSQKTSKFFTVNSDCTNLPATENFIGEIQAHHDGLWKKVLMLSIYGNGTPARMFTGVELNGNWSGWNEYLLTNGNVPMTGGLKVNGGHGTIGAIEQYTSISHIEKPGTNNYRNLTVTNQGETSEAVVLHEVRNGVETKTHKLYGEHYKPTSEDVGALPISGGNLTGDLKLKKELPRIQMNDSSNSRYGIFEMGADGYVSIGNWKENSDQHNLQIRKPSDGLEEALRLTVNGASVYRIFGEHNKNLLRNTLMTASTTDLEAGTSELETGKIYFVYE